MFADDDFKKIVAVLRLAVPYTGLILSTREEAELRDEIIALDASQVSSGSCTGVGGYSESAKNTMQFEVGDNRSPMEMLESLIKSGDTFQAIVQLATDKGVLEIDSWK